MADTKQFNNLWLYYRNTEKIINEVEASYFKRKSKF